MGHTYTKKPFIAYLKFEFRQVFCILSSHPILMVSNLSLHIFTFLLMIPGGLERPFCFQRGIFVQGCEGRLGPWGSSCNTSWKTWI